MANQPSRKRASTKVSTKAPTPRRSTRVIKREATLESHEAPSPRAKGMKRKRNEATDENETFTPRSKKVKTVKTETKDCDICAEPFPTRSFPVIPSCEHDATVCNTCYQRQFEMKIDENKVEGWEVCTCPLCNETVGVGNAQAIFTRVKVRELDKKIKQARTEAALNFIWCPNPKCGHGKVYTPTKRPYVSCTKCRTKICLSHRGRWHAGMTCHEYDEAGDKDETAKKDMAEIKRTTKPCPYCKIRVKKEGGCNHMVCSGCKKHWRWDEVAFDGESRGDGREVVGGPQVAPALPPDDRDLMHMINAFENGELHRLPQNNDAFGIRRRMLDGIRDAAAMIADGLRVFRHQTVNPRPLIPVTQIAPQGNVPPPPMQVPRHLQMPGDGGRPRATRDREQANSRRNANRGRRARARRMPEVIDLTVESEDEQESRQAVGQVVTERVVIDLTMDED